MSTSTPSTSHGADTGSTASPANGPANPVATANAADAAGDSPAAIEAGIKVYNRTNGKPIVNSADAGSHVALRGEEPPGEDGQEGR